MYRNNEHYPDPTAGAALLSNLRTERKNRREAGKLLINELVLCLRRDPGRFVRVLSPRAGELPCLLCSIGGRAVAFGLPAEEICSPQAQLFRHLELSGGLTYTVRSVVELEDILLRLESLSREGA